MEALAIQQSRTACLDLAVGDLRPLEGSAEEMAPGVTQVPGTLRLIAALTRTPHAKSPPPGGFLRD